MLAIIPAAGTDKVLKTSLKHVLDEDFLFAMDSKASATYISSHISDDGEGTVFFSLSDWDNLKPSLSAAGWDGDTMPGFIDLLDAIAAQGYNTVEFHISHPLVVGAVWFTDEYYFTVTPLAYDLATLDGQFVLPDGSSYRLDDLDEVSYDEMTDYFDGIIEVDGDTMLGVKRNDDDTVNVSKIES